MAITLNGSTGVTAAEFDGALDASNLTGDIDASQLTGALPAIDGSALTGVGSSTDFGAVGTYIWGRPANQVNYGFGDTASGLYATKPLSQTDMPRYYEGADVWTYSAGQSAVSGTWRAMTGGHIASGYSYTGLWVRIS